MVGARSGSDTRHLGPKVSEGSSTDRIGVRLSSITGSHGAKTFTMKRNVEWIRAVPEQNGGSNF